MRDRRYDQPDHEPVRGAERERDVPAVGRRTLVEAVYGPAIQLWHAAAGMRSRPSFVELVSGAAVQRSEAGEHDDVDVHTSAARGVASASSPLPHLELIQHAFGHHDVSGVRAQVGGPAVQASAELGARAYASGDAVAFAASPDLHLAAHEAAHVVQQRGGVRLSGGIGRAGDEYEQHADAVAELVVQGRSAESLLDRYAHRGAAGGPAVQRDPETMEQLTAAVVAADLAGLRPALQTLGQFRRRPRERRTEIAVRIAGTRHLVAPADVPALRDAVRQRLQDLGAVRTPAAEQAIIDAAIRAVARNETGGSAVAPQSHMDTSAPNPAEPQRGQHASYASASQMIPAHAVDVLQHAQGGRELAAEHGLDGAALDDAASTIAASNAIWNAVVEGGRTYAQLTGNRRTAAHLARCGFTPADIERMIEFREFRRVLLANRGRVLGIVSAVEDLLLRQHPEPDALIAEMRAEIDGSARGEADPDATSSETAGAERSAEDGSAEGAGADRAGAQARGEERAAPSADGDARAPQGAAPDGGARAPQGASPGGDARAPQGASPDGDTRAPQGTSPDGDTRAPQGTSPDGDARAPQGASPDGDASSDAPVPASAGDAAAALALVPANSRNRLTAAERVTRPRDWTRRRPRQRQQFVDGAARRLAAARHHVACVAADRFVTHEILPDPAVAAMRFPESTIRAYISSERHFLRRWGEDRAGWARYALQHRTASEPGAPNLDARIAGAAAAEGGHRLTQIDFEQHLRDYLRRNPLATDEQVVTAAADRNSGGSQAYRARILANFRRDRSAAPTEGEAPVP